MSLIDESHSGLVWVDEGYLNNSQLHAFDLEKGTSPKTLGLDEDVQTLF